MDWVNWLAETLQKFLVGIEQDRKAGIIGPSLGLQVPLGSGYSAEDDESRKRAKIVAYCRAQLSKVYQFGVEVGPGQESQSWDCSELSEVAYREAGLQIPDGARYQFDFCRAAQSPLPGDLGFLWSDDRGMIGHVMISTGSGSVIHAVGGRGVVEDWATNWEISPRWRGWRRHPDFSTRTP